MYRVRILQPRNLLMLVVVVCVLLTAYVHRLHMKTDGTAASWRERNQTKHLVGTARRQQHEQQTPQLTCVPTDAVDAKADVDTYSVFLRWMHAGRKSRGSPTLPLTATDATLQPLRVFVVPHSHNDPGWLHTVDEYFDSKTSHILDNIVAKLEQYADMTFIWTETVFLDMWWRRATPTMRARFVALVGSGRLEITGGGWVMPDEAVTHYYSVVDQYIEGHEWLWHNVGVRPRNSWQIDPFGHSSSIAYILNLVGFENAVIHRIHHGFKWHLATERNLEFRWRQYWDAEDARPLFTHATPNQHYTMKWTCGPDTAVCSNFDFRHVVGEFRESMSVPITKHNVATKARQLLDQYRQKAALYRHNVLLVPHGDDFRYDKPAEFDQQYVNLRRLFAHINAQPWDADVRFGTLQDYFDAVHEREGALLPAKLPTLTGDFFPYSDERTDYWSGFYTTRPFNKRLERLLASRLRAADVVFTLRDMTTTERDADAAELLTFARRQLGLFQHHDAITGTSEDHVADDYSRKLWLGLHAVDRVILRTVQAYALADGHLRDVVTRGNMTLIHMNEQMRTYQSLPLKQLVGVRHKAAHVLLYNALTLPRHELVRVHVNHPHVVVRDGDGVVVRSQVNPLWRPDDPTRISDAAFEVAFLARVPATSVAVFSVAKSKPDAEGTAVKASVVLLGGAASATSSVFAVDTSPQELFIQNDALVAWFDSRSGFLQGVTDKNTSENIQLGLDFHVCKSRHSGAYLLGDLHAREPLLVGESSPVIRLVKGPLAEEIHVIAGHVVSGNVINTIAVDKTQATSASALRLDISNLVDAGDLVNREVIMQLKTDTNSGDTFYADLNGLQVVKRTTYRMLPTDGARFYPATSLVAVQDRRVRVSLLLSQTHAVASPATGTLEVILERRIAENDGKGVSGGVTSVPRSLQRHTLLVERRGLQRHTADESHVLRPTMRSHRLSQRLNDPLIAMVADAQLDPLLLKRVVDLPLSLPCDVQLVSLRPLLPADSAAASEYALLVHRPMYECRDDDADDTGSCAAPQPATSFADVLPGVRVSRVARSSLSFLKTDPSVPPSRMMIVNSMEIAAFRLEVDHKRARRQAVDTN
ncbi:PREDICTED: alpha-mannosidase 2x-like [Priapulus caudatus]|uniref:Alpha-mannosidase n=1 Tax=Priapulus caudatus TaxID=37621 RepID=A0ABM1E342_PRICU|nr:PREDICTED: alpha-mannosidase 2x-like [Priapulus caudatus]